MLLDLWEWFLLISDGVDIVLSNLTSGTSAVPFSFIIVILFFGLISLFAWRSTDIPDLPPAPRPPYLIQITTGPGSGGVHQTIADVRLLSGGAFLDGNELLARYDFPRSQATNTTTDQNSQQPGTSAGPTAATGFLRNVTSRGGQTLDATTATGPIRRRIPGRSFLLGLFRRPNSLVRPAPNVSNAIRAQLSSPNLVVYHRVNVYHHHIHSHQGPPVSPVRSTADVGGSSSSTDRPQANQEVNAGERDQASNQSQNSGATTVAASSASLDSASAPQNFSQNQQNPNTLSPGEATRVNGLNYQSNDVHTCSTTTSINSSRDSVNANNNSSAGVCSVDSVQGHSSEELTIRDFHQSLFPSSSSAVPSTSSPPQPPNMTSTATGGDVGDGVPFPKPSNTTQPKPASGSGPSFLEDDVRFTIKFLNDTQMDVTSQLGEKIVDFKRRHFATELSENKTVRLIFNGRVLDNDNKTLREFGIFDQCVVHCLIVNRQQQTPEEARSGGSSGRANGLHGESGHQGNARRVVGLPEPGMFFVAFIGIFLVFLWFICLHFGQHLFTQSAVVSLTVLTAIFLIGIVACYLPLPTN